MKKWYMLFTLIAVILCLSACGCKHEWLDATCTSPQRCKLCNKSEGEMLPHKWRDATCTNPKTCSVCGETDGTPADHSWKDATCQSPRTCVECGATEGEKSSHVPGDWKLREPDYVNAEQLKVKECTVCGDVVKQERLEINSLHDGIYVIPSMKEFSERLQKVCKSYTGTNVEIRSTQAKGNFAIQVYDDNGELVGALLFTNVEGAMISDSKKSERNCIGKFFGFIEDSKSAVVLSMALMETMLPSLSFDQAKEMAGTLIDREELIVEGVKFVFSDLGGDNFLVGFMVE